MSPRLCQRLNSRSAFPLPRHAVEHLAEGALELLPVLLRGEDLVDALERLEVARVEIERLVEELDRAILIVHLVAIELRHRVEVTCSCDSGSFSMLGDRAGACRPSSASSRSPGRAASSLWSSTWFCGSRSRASSSASIAFGGFFSLSVQMSPISLSILKRSSPSNDVVEDLPLVGDDLLPVLELRRRRRPAPRASGGARRSRPSAFSKLLIACLAWPCSRLMQPSW